MFERIFIEKDIATHPRTISLLERLPKIPTKEIAKVEDIWGRVKKPYLQKRDSLNLFIGEKKGELVKVAPDAYGLSGDPHYYFVHAYNCIYECEYCYLQGHFNTPDMVLFVNHEDVGEEIKKLAAAAPAGTTPWFHAGEYSDSLALSHLSGELPYYFELFKNLPHAKMELRTKSVNTRELEQLEPLPNIITSFSLSPEKRTRKTDLKTPPLSARLKAIKRLVKCGHKVGIHFDPVIYEDNFESEYQQLIDQLMLVLPADKIEYLSIGVVRFTKDVYHQVEKNYPESDLLAENFVKSFDGKIRYNRPMRMWMMGKIKQQALNAGIAEEKIYLCME